MTNEEFIQSIALPGEEWRDVVGYEGLYAVSSYGRIASVSVSYLQFKNGKEYRYSSKPCLKKAFIQKSSPYYRVSLASNGTKKTFLVHRIVALAFLQNPSNLPYVDHKDDCATNNNVSNLQWCTAEFNNSKSHHRETSSVSHKGQVDPKRKPIVQIKDGVAIRVYNSAYEAGIEGHSKASIQRVLKGKMKRHHGCEWMYLSDYESLVQYVKELSTNRLCGGS